MIGDGSDLDMLDDSVMRNARIVSEDGIKAVAYIAASVSILLTAGRLVMHQRTSGRLRVDDIFNAIAAVLVVPFIAICLVALPIESEAQRYALGMEEAPPSMSELQYANTLTFTSLTLFWLIIYAVKGSFLSLYWHIFAVSSRFRIVWWLTAGYTATSFCITFLSVFWICGSPSKVNDIAACVTTDPQMETNLLLMWCILNVFGGLLLMALPVFMVTTRMLQLQRSAKLGLIFIFSLVLVDIAFDITRTVYSLSDDLIHRTNHTALWSFLEPTIAVIVCALPCYKSLLTRKRPMQSGNSGERFSRSLRPHSTSIPVEMELGDTERLSSRQPSLQDEGKIR